MKKRSSTCIAYPFKVKDDVYHVQKLWWINVFENKFRVFDWIVIKIYPFTNYLKRLTQVLPTGQKTVYWDSDRIILQKQQKRYLLYATEIFSKNWTISIFDWTMTRSCYLKLSSYSSSPWVCSIKMEHSNFWEFWSFYSAVITLAFLVLLMTHKMKNNPEEPLRKIKIRKSVLRRYERKIQYKRHY